MELLQYVLSPFLMYPVPYKNSLGIMQLSLFDFVKELDSDSLERFEMLVIRKVFLPISNLSLALYCEIF